MKCPQCGQAMLTERPHVHADAQQPRPVAPHGLPSPDGRFLWDAEQARWEPRGSWKEAAASSEPLDADALTDIIEQAIFETGTGLEAALLASDRIVAALARSPEPVAATGLDVERLAVALFHTRQLRNNDTEWDDLLPEWQRDEIDHVRMALAEYARLAAAEPAPNGPEQG